MKFFQNLTPNQKSTLLKFTVILALIIVGFTLLSRFFTSGSETLSEYAERNPELALGNEAVSDTETTLSKTGTSATATVPVETDNSQPFEETVPIVETPKPTETPIPTSTPAPIHPKRITYVDSFYYEPLSEELISYITGVSYPAEGTDVINYADLRYVHILHYDFDGNVTDGELICNQAIAQDFVEIFYELYVAEYQIEKVTLIENYNGDDTASMLDNNTSCFNFRPVDGTDKLSKHAYGLAIDINPFYNPYVTYTSVGTQNVSPEGSEIYADRSQEFPYKIDADDLCYKLFIEHGFIWGGNWNSCKDYQHFQKTIDG